MPSLPSLPSQDEIHLTSNGSGVGGTTGGVVSRRFRNKLALAMRHYDRALQVFSLCPSPQAAPLGDEEAFTTNIMICLDIARLLQRVCFAIDRRVSPKWQSRSVCRSQVERVEDALSRLLSTGEAFSRCDARSDEHQHRRWTDLAADVRSEVQAVLLSLVKRYDMPQSVELYGPDRLGTAKEMYRLALSSSRDGGRREAVVVLLSRIKELFVSFS